MVTARYDAILFDFFGTLVEYSPSRTEQGYRASHRVLQTLGYSLDYSVFLTTWNTISEQFDAEAEARGGEFSMDEVVDAFLRQVTGDCIPEQVNLFRDTYISEWSTAIRPIPGAAEMLADLSRSYSVAVVTNTHDLNLVPGLLEAHGMAGSVRTTVMSVEVRSRKPDPGIFRATVNTIGVDPSRCLFVGDSYIPDYVGPTRFGMDALLIDPNAMSATPERDRISSILDVADRAIS